MDKGFLSVPQILRIRRSFFSVGYNPTTIDKVFFSGEWHSPGMEEELIIAWVDVGHVEGLSGFEGKETVMVVVLGTDHFVGLHHGV